MRPNGWLALVVIVLAALAATPAEAQSGPPQPAAAMCVERALPSGASGRYCIPTGAWAGDLVVYVPGFAPTPGFRNLELPDGTSLPDLVTGLGYAFATSTVGQYEDTGELIRAFPAVAGQPARRVYVTGVSQGGLVATQGAERPPAPINGALAVCGPIGDYRAQIDYFGDFRALFDYFFPGVLPPSAVDIPNDLMANWTSSYVPAVGAALSANPAAAEQLLAVSQAAVDDSSPAAHATSVVSTTVGVLSYNVFATNVGRARYGGNPYDNAARAYAGSSNDAALNQGVGRYSADQAARLALALDETSGRPTVPLVVLQTSRDEIVPAWHALLYQQKAQQNGARGVSVTIVERYGHCNVTSGEVLTAFLALTRAADTWRWRVALPVVAGQ
jgi:pimeloyl-ACP methyl ester carboxylesterase